MRIYLCKNFKIYKVDKKKRDPREREKKSCNKRIKYYLAVLIFLRTPFFDEERK